MNQADERFWSASAEQLAQGYTCDGDDYICLICGHKFELGVIYRHADRLLDAPRMAREHVSAEHGGMFKYLLGLDRKLTGLTELQSRILGLMHRGLSDQEIVRATGGGSTSTVRAHRFKLREKERQARVLLALMGLLGVEETTDEKFIPVHKGATMVDERFAITEEEYKKAIDTYFKDGKLATMPSKQKRKVMVLRHIAEAIPAKTDFSETEINEKLAAFYDDYVMLRRYLIDYGYLERTRDGSRYWVKV